MAIEIPDTTKMGQSEAREAFKLAFVRQWEHTYGTIIQERSDEPRFTIEDMASMADDVLRTIQNMIGDKADELSHVLWSNANGGYDGRVSQVKEKSRALLDKADILLGGER